MTKVPAFDFPAIGQLFGDVLTGALKNALKGFGLGLGDLITSLNLGSLFSGALGGLGDTLGGLFGLAAPAAANAVPASVQKSLVAGSTVTAKDNKLTASSAATADAKTAPAKPTLDSVKATPKGSASQSFGSQVSAAAAGFGASTTKGPLKTAKHAKAAASSSKAGAAK